MLQPTHKRGPQRQSYAKGFWSNAEDSSWECSIELVRVMIELFDDNMSKAQTEKSDKLSRHSEIFTAGGCHAGNETTHSHPLREDFL